MLFILDRAFCISYNSYRFTRRNDIKLSRQSQYALRALIDLAARDESCPVRLGELAARNQIPNKFLEQIFTRLRHAGIVSSRVGPHGGYALARPPAAITVGEVIRMLDG